MYHIRKVTIGNKDMLVCTTLYNDKGYGDRSLIFFSYDDGKPEYTGRIDNVADELITNIIKYDENKLVVTGLPAHSRVIEFVQATPNNEWI